MGTNLKISSASKATKYFQDKMAFTTGPVELERWVKQGEPANIVDVRASEDHAEGHFLGVVNLPKAQWHNTHPPFYRLPFRRSWEKLSKG